MLPEPGLSRDTPGSLFFTGGTIVDTVSDKQTTNRVMAKEIIYGGNKIIQYGPTSFLATALDEDGEVITKFTRTLDKAQEWLDEREN